MTDELGQRIKSQYEDRTRYFIPRRTYTICRLDGKAFHAYTKGLNKPFDDALSSDIDNAIIAMLPQIQGAVFAYTQSDEISVLLCDFATPNTSAWFDGNIQKMASVSASIITAEFNRLRCKRWSSLEFDFPSTANPPYSLDTIINKQDELSYFDSRIFSIPDRTEVMNYFIWRGNDCSRNSVSMVAQSLFSHTQLQGKSTPQMQEMMFKEHNVNWATYDQAKKNGRLIVKEEYTIKAGESEGTEFAMFIDTQRNIWVSKPAWKFTEDKEKLLEMIPTYV